MGGSSILMTSAPRSAKRWVTAAPGMSRLRSRIRSPRSGSNISAARVLRDPPLEERALRLLGVLVGRQLPTEPLLELVAGFEVHELDLVHRALGEADGHRAVAGDHGCAPARLREQLVGRNDREHRAVAEEVLG